MSEGLRRSPLHRIIHSLGAATLRLGLAVPPLEIERWGVALHHSLSARARDFHSYEHVLDLVRPDDPLETIAALYHDYGKIDVPLAVLNKSGKFSDEEWKLMRNHVLFGVPHLLDDLGLTETGFRRLLVAMQHHQTIDGGGAMFCTGGAFELSGTIGQPDAGPMAGGSLELTGGFWFPLAPADCNSDSTINLVDFGALQPCVSGPQGGLAPRCSCYDLDRDGDIDLSDFASFQQSFAGG